MQRKGLVKELKRMTFQFFLGAEIIVVTFFYLIGPGGLQALKSAQRQNSNLIEEIKRTEGEVNALSRELADRKNNPFYKESIARKELQMAYENEIIYLLPGR